MAKSHSKPVGPNARVARDLANAKAAQNAADVAMARDLQFKPQSDMVRGMPGPQMAIANSIGRDQLDLRKIVDRAFDAMVEAEVQNAKGTERVLWYAHRDTAGNQSLSSPGGDIRILSWTHPGIQLGLATPLNETADVRRAGLLLKSVTPLARARFDSLVPQIVGLYEPGGQAGDRAEQPPSTRGLKAVKLEMTQDQVHAFVNHMRGVLIVTGAPGTGKTTVALQRIRFLFDQQNANDSDDRTVRYTPTLTKVFLASRSLIAYTRSLLRDELQIPADVVSHVGDFVSVYVEKAWNPRLDARPIGKNWAGDELRAREALSNLGTSQDLHAMWRILEAQIRDRFNKAVTADWYAFASAHSDSPAAIEEFVATLKTLPQRSAIEPQDSSLRVDALWPRVGGPYQRMRTAISGKRREEFDAQFARWLFYAFDPLDVLADYFTKYRAVTIQRIQAGVGSTVNAGQVVDDAIEQWRKRRYSSHDLSWIAWMCRFWLPEERDVTMSFRGIPRALPELNSHEGFRWTHVVIDEAQDLSVQEASFLGSLVHPNGALTVSADYRQVVSPVHGTEDSEALKVGLSIRDQRLHRQFPFKQNMRQGREIAMFLAGFYEHTFGEFPRFTPGPREVKVRPQLITGPLKQFARTVRQFVNVMEAKGRGARVAILFTDEADVRMRNIRTDLHSLGISPGPIDEVWSDGQLVMTTVERAKGLEYDIVTHASMGQTSTSRACTVGSACASSLRRYEGRGLVLRLSNSGSDRVVGAGN